MSRYLPSTLVGTIFILLLIVYTLAYNIALMVLGVMGWLAPDTFWERGLRKARGQVFVSWAAVTRGMFRFWHGTEYEVRLPEGLRRDEWYMVVSNHCSWSDIPVLIAFLQKDIPQLAFFLKKQLIWVPIVGWVSYFADMPFMERYTASYLKKNPHKRGKDLEATRKACEKFEKVPVSLINFLEGTRYTAEKHKRQASIYKLLLKPKTGGFAYAISAMDGKMHKVLDVTLVYSGPKLRNFWGQLGGKAERVVVDVRLRDLPDEFQCRDYSTDKPFRAAFQTWVNRIWREKEERILEIKEEIGDDPVHSFPWPDPAAFAAAEAKQQALAIKEAQS